MPRTLSVAGVSLMLALFTAPALANDTAPVVAAERAFAAQGLELGWVAAFKRNAAPDGITFSPEPVNAQANLAKLPEGKDPVPLTWWPVWAGMARSGDMGFTMGPFAIGDKGFGHFFTVWVRQPDGSWKWIYDGGPRNKEKSPLGPDTEPASLPPATAAAGSAEAAMKQVTALESALAAQAASDARAAYLAHLAPDARVMGSPEQPATTPEAVTAELARRAPALSFAALGGKASSAGDLAFTYGSAAWTGKDGQPHRGHYVRIWQNRTQGWKLVFDELLPVPPAKS